MKAIELNANNVEASTRLGTLVHIYGHSYLGDAQGQEYKKWLQALKLST
jgi:hypothetical protein